MEIDQRYMEFCFLLLLLGDDQRNLMMNERFARGDGEDLLKRRMIEDIDVERKEMI